LKFKTLEFVEININDAKELNLKNGDELIVESKRGSLKANVIISSINEKTIFIPVSHININVLTNNKLDPLSKEPDYNHISVKLIKI